MKIEALLYYSYVSFHLFKCVQNLLGYLSAKSGVRLEAAVAHSHFKIIRLEIALADRDW
jgi:heme A synthase